MPLVDPIAAARDAHGAALALASDYPAAYQVYDDEPALHSPADPQAVIVRGSRPDSRAPSGRDHHVALALHRATRHLQRAHQWAQAWRWPAKPWQHEHALAPVESTCEVCHGAGSGRTPLRVDTELVRARGAQTVVLTVALPIARTCHPCHGTGSARALVDPGLPVDAWIASSAAYQLAGYLEQLTRRSSSDLGAVLELATSTRLAAEQVAWAGGHGLRICAECGRRPAASDRRQCWQCVGQRVA